MKNPLEILVLAIGLLIALFAGDATAQETLIGTTDITSYIREVKNVPDNLPEAMLRTYGTDEFKYNSFPVESFYKDLKDRMEAVQKKYAEFYGKKQSSATYSEAQAKADMNKNPIIASMGGADAVMNMSEEEARAAATKAAAEYAADPFAASGAQSAGMKALYQKIISDPVYAERFNKMSEKEKEAELRKYMASDQPQAMTTSEMNAYQQKKQQQQTEADKVRNAQEIQMKMNEWTQQMQVAMDAFSQQMASIAEQPGSHADIQSAFAKKYEAVPIVELGEYGHDKDPEMMQKLRIEEALAHSKRAETELRLAREPLEKLRLDFTRIAESYKSWLSVNASKVNGDMQGFYNGTHTEIPLANFEMNLLGMAAALIDQCENYTAAAARWQRSYLELVKD